MQQVDYNIIIVKKEVFSINFVKFLAKLSNNFSVMFFNQKSQVFLINYMQEEYPLFNFLYKFYTRSTAIVTVSPLTFHSFVIANSASAVILSAKTLPAIAS